MSGKPTDTKSPLVSVYSGLSARFLRSLMIEQELRHAKLLEKHRIEQELRHAEQLEKLRKELSKNFEDRLQTAVSEYKRLLLKQQKEEQQRTQELQARVRQLEKELLQLETMPEAVAALLTPSPESSPRRATGIPSTSTAPPAALSRVKDDFPPRSVSAPNTTWQDLVTMNDPDGQETSGTETELENSEISGTETEPEDSKTPARKSEKAKSKISFTRRRRGTIGHTSSTKPSRKLTPEEIQRRTACPPHTPPPHSRGFLDHPFFPFIKGRRVVRPSDPTKTRPRDEPLKSQTETKPPIKSHRHSSVFS